MTKDPNGVSNWTMATGTKPGERYVYREAPPNPGAGSAHVRPRCDRVMGRRRRGPIREPITVRNLLCHWS